MSRNHDESRLEPTKLLGNFFWWFKLVMASVAFVAEIETEPFEGSDALLGIEIQFTHTDYTRFV